MDNSEMFRLEGDTSTVSGIDEELKNSIERLRKHWFDRSIYGDTDMIVTQDYNGDELSWRPNLNAVPETIQYHHPIKYHHIDIANDDDEIPELVKCLGMCPKCNFSTIHQAKSIALM